MTKEQILALMFDSVETFVHRSAELKSNPEFKAAFLAQYDRVADEYDRANSCDKYWMDDEFGKWFREKFPDIKSFQDYLINMGYGDIPLK
jgi:hypothetical protein